MNTPPEATPERLAWVASLKEGDEVWIATAISQRRDLVRLRPWVSGGFNAGGHLVAPDGHLRRRGYKSWLEPFTDEDRAVMEYKNLYRETESRCRNLYQHAQYGYLDRNISSCVEELKRINRLLDEAGL